MDNIIDVEFKESEVLLIKMAEDFNKLGTEALFMDHYELAKKTIFSPQNWKEFLTDPRISDDIETSMVLYRRSKYRKILKEVDANSKSTGIAQTLSLLQKSLEDEGKKEGPIFIYTYIPPNEQEAKSEVINTQEFKPFEFK